MHLDSRDFGQVSGGSAGGCQHVVFRGGRRGRSSGTAKAAPDLHLVTRSSAGFLLPWQPGSPGPWHSRSASSAASATGTTSSARRRASCGRALPRVGAPNAGGDPAPISARRLAAVKGRGRASRGPPSFALRPRQSSSRAVRPLRPRSKGGAIPAPKCRPSRAARDGRLRQQRAAPPPQGANPGVSSSGGAGTAVVAEEKRGKKRGGGTPRWRS